MINNPGGKKKAEKIGAPNPANRLGELSRFVVRCRGKSSVVL
jgi:hypothetical protein